MVIATTNKNRMIGLLCCLTFFSSFLLVSPMTCQAETPSVITITSGDVFTVALLDDGTVWAWGLNDHGQLGDNTLIDRSTPGKVLIDDVKEIYTDFGLCLAVKKDGTVWAWGWNNDGSLPGHGENITMPVQLKGLSNITVLSKGDTGDMGVALKDDGTLWAWSKRTTPERIPEPNDVKMIDGNMALTGDGYVWTWLGRETPTKFANLNNITIIEGDLALQDDGTVWSLRQNIGPDSIGFMDNPVASRVPITDVKMVSSEVNIIVTTSKVYDGSINFALKADGTVWGWGENLQGFLGDGSWTEKGEITTVPVKVKDLNNVVAISNSLFHALALKSDGTIWAWGSNGDGQRGDPNVKPVRLENAQGKYGVDLTPNRVLEIDHVVKIFAFNDKSIAIKDDGTIWAWGLNNYGQIGIGLTRPAGTK